MKKMYYELLQKINGDKLKLINSLLIAAIVILTLMSIIALLSVQWIMLRDFSFELSPEGINRYLVAFGHYKGLFAATVATIAGYLGLLRLEAATAANYDKLKQDRFSEFKAVLDVRFLEIERNDPYMKREFIGARLGLFRQLFDFNFTINEKDTLVRILNDNFSGRISFWEDQNEKHIGMGGIYLDATFSYSYDSFRFLFLGCLENFYQEIENDLREIYLQYLPGNRIIDEQLYIAAQQNFRRL